MTASTTRAKWYFGSAVQVSVAKCLIINAVETSYLSLFESLLVTQNSSGVWDRVSKLLKSMYLVLLPCDQNLCIHYGVNL